MVVEKPTVAVEKPTVVVEKPAVTVEKPVVAVEKPAVVVEKPAVAVEKPTVVVEKPTVAVEKPAVAVEKPAVAVDFPLNVSKTAGLAQFFLDSISKQKNNSQASAEPTPTTAPVALKAVIAAKTGGAGTEPKMTTAVAPRGLAPEVTKSKDPQCSPRVDKENAGPTLPSYIRESIAAIGLGKLQRNWTKAPPEVKPLPCRPPRVPDAEGYVSCEESPPAGKAAMDFSFSDMLD